MPKPEVVELELLPHYPQKEEPVLLDQRLLIDAVMAGIGSFVFCTALFKPVPGPETHQTTPPTTIEYEEEQYIEFNGNLIIKPSP